MGARTRATSATSRDGLEERQKYLFAVREELIYGWGSPIDAAIACIKDRLEQVTGSHESSEPSETSGISNVMKGDGGGNNRFGRVADNVLEEAWRRSQDLDLPYLPFPRPHSP
jgi:hypothetical protein